MLESWRGNLAERDVYMFIIVPMSLRSRNIAWINTYIYVHKIFVLQIFGIIQILKVFKELKEKLTPQKKKP